MLFDNIVNYRTSKEHAAIHMIVH